MGAFAGSIGFFLKEYDRLVDLISGGIIILFGLHFIGILKIPVLDKQKGISFQTKEAGFFSSLVFGVVFSISWTPCVGVFLGSALMLASSSGGSLQGILLLLCYSLGLAVPFLLSAVLIERLKSTFQFIKKNYRVISLISGIILILAGILTMTGTMGYFFALFNQL
jgi:cytochrome c-type biogenesis protein